MAVEVAVTAVVVDAAATAEVVGVVDAEAATTVTKMAILLANVLREDNKVEVAEVTTTAIRQENKTLLGILMTKKNEKWKKPSMNRLEDSFRCQANINFGLSDAVYYYLQLSLNVFLMLYKSPRRCHRCHYVSFASKEVEVRKESKT